MKRWLVISVIVFAGCGSPTPGLWRQWEADWTFLRVEHEWVRGVELGSARSLKIEQRGVRFRARVLNSGDHAGDLVVTGSGFHQKWSVPAGSSLDVESSALSRGHYRIEGPIDLILGEPRLVVEDPQARLLVFVVVDTLRAQAVNPETTPKILEALEGARDFKDTTANSPWTLPSMASMFTSRPVFELTTPTGDLIGIPEGVDTWAKALRNGGFSGCGIVANYTVHVQNGYAQGFDAYLVPDLIPEEGGLPDATWVVDHAQRWIEAHKGENAFVYLHLMDPHEPYRDHIKGLPAPDLFGLAHRNREATPEEAERLRMLYQGEVRHVDDVMGPFLEELSDDAVVVFTADHGEALGEHGFWAHGFTLFEPVVRVPLLIRSPGLEGGDDPRQTQLLDLAPTVLDLLGFPAPSTMKGVSLLRGGSTTATISATFSPGPMRWMWRQGATKVVVRTADQPLVAEGFRKAVEEGSPAPEGVFCYDLDVDPGELHPGPVPDDILPSVIRDFALSAGRLVPGLQVFSIGSKSGSKIELSLPGIRDFHQVWSVAPVSASWSQSTVTIEAEKSEFMTLVAISGSGSPADVVVSQANPPWRGPQSSGTDLPAELMSSQGFDASGTYVWWNPGHDIVVGYHDETMEKLRALGYIQ